MFQNQPKHPSGRQPKTNNRRLQARFHFYLASLIIRFASLTTSGLRLIALRPLYRLNAGRLCK